MPSGQQTGSSDVYPEALCGSSINVDAYMYVCVVVVFMYVVRGRIKLDDLGLISEPAQEFLRLHLEGPEQHSCSQ